MEKLQFPSIILAALLGVAGLWLIVRAVEAFYPWF